MHVLPPRWFSRVSLIAVCLLAPNPLPSRAENWPQWRGPDGNGVSRETKLPIAWTKTSGVVWQCPLPEWGNSTPAIWGNAIFVTTQVDDEKLLLLRINKKTGQIEWSRAGRRRNGQRMLGCD